MSAKSDYLAFWGYVEGTPEAEAAWTAKVAMMEGKRFFATPMIFVSGDVCYDSPIDGRAITSRQQRIEDMKRNDCVEYDPCMKQDQERHLKEKDAFLDRQVENYVEERVHKMPGRQREQLANELLSGVTAEPIRLTAKG